MNDQQITTAEQLDAALAAQRAENVMSTHAHNFDGQWPFDDPINSAVFCCEQVHSLGAPILYVTHDHDGEWQFLCGAAHVGETPRLVCLGCMVERDPTLWTLADMPRGWGADRPEPGAPWNREANPEPIEEPQDDADEAPHE